MYFTFNDDAQTVDRIAHVYNDVARCVADYFKALRQPLQGGFVVIFE